MVVYYFVSRTKTETHNFKLVKITYASFNPKPKQLQILMFKHIFYS